MDRYYSFKIVTYHTDLQVIEDFCKLTFKYAFAFHDKDEVSPHYHILCTFKGNKSFQAVRNLFPSVDKNGVSTNTLVKPMTDKVGDFLYLTHKNAPEKYQYSDDIVNSNDFSFFEDKQRKSVDNEEFLNDISVTSMLTYKELAVKYGRDYIKNYKVYNDFAHVMDRQERCLSRGYNDKVELLSYEEFQYDVHHFVELGLILD